LYLCRDFCRAYPQILQTLSAKSYLIDFQQPEILRTASAELPDLQETTRINQLLTQLSFFHFIELLKADKGAKRRFCEEETGKLTKSTNKQ
jgi:hypothetical protein